MSEFADSALKRLELVGQLTIERAASLKSELLEGLEGARTLVLDFAKVEELDLSCLQLIYAARRLSAAEGKNLHLTGPLNRRVAAKLAAAGFAAVSAATAEALEASLVDF